MSSHIAVASGDVSVMYIAQHSIDLRKGMVTISSLLRRQERI